MLTADRSDAGHRATRRITSPYPDVPGLPPAEFFEAYHRHPWYSQPRLDRLIPLLDEAAFAFLRRRLAAERNRSESDPRTRIDGLTRRSCLAPVADGRLADARQAGRRKCLRSRPECLLRRPAARGLRTRRRRTSSSWGRSGTDPHRPSGLGRARGRGRARQPPRGGADPGRAGDRQRGSSSRRVEPRRTIRTRATPASWPVRRRTGPSSRSSATSWPAASAAWLRFEAEGSVVTPLQLLSCTAI